MPTIQEIFDNSRALLQGGNTSSALGLGNAILQNFLNQAYTEMWQTMESVQVPRISREFYFLVPAYTSQVNPATAGVTDMGEPQFMYERGGLTSVQIAETSNTTPVQVTTVGAHGLSSNADVTIGQVTGSQAPWGRWFVTVLDSTTLTLNGSVADGNAGIGGTLTTSEQSFRNRPVAWLHEEEDRALGPQLFDCLWEEGIFKFRGATEDAQIMVKYFANATLPANATTELAVAGADAFLAVRTASLAARSRGWYEMSSQLKQEALGASGDPNEPGGLLRSFLNIQVQGLARNIYRKQPFRPDGWDGDEYPYGTGLGSN